MNKNGNTKAQGRKTFIYEGGGNPYGPFVYGPFVYGPFVPKSESIKYTHVHVNEGVESIGPNVFHSWSRLRSIYIPNSVKRIEFKAFCGCTNLTEIHLPQSIEYIGEFAFQYCVNITKLELPDSITEIRGNAFSHCSSLLYVTLPPAITTIHEGVFLRCVSLSKVIIPSSVKNISYLAFAGCENVSSIIIPKGVEAVGKAAFAGCKSLRSIQLPTSTTSVGDYAFVGCISLSIVYIPAAAFQEEPNEVFEANSRDWDFFRSCYSYRGELDFLTTTTTCSTVLLSNVILLTDADGFEYEGKSSITLTGIRQCIDELPNNIPESEQLNHLYEAMNKPPYLSFQRIVEQMQHYNMNILHLLAYIPRESYSYFPGDIYDTLSDVIDKCPQFTSAVDTNKMTPLHHIITSTWHNMDTKCFNLLVEKSPNTVVHKSIRSGSPWREICKMVKANIDGLRVEDEESGLVPFMVAAEEGSSFRLSVVYKLLLMQPDVMNKYV